MSGGAVGFVGRKKLVDAFATWLRDQKASRFFVVHGAGGSGKTTALDELAGRAADLSDDVGLAVAIHHCVPGDVATRNPTVAAETLGLQLSARLRGFPEALVQSASAGRQTIHGEATADAVHGTNAGVVIGTLVVNASVEDAWHNVLRKPLEAMAAQGELEQVLLVIDAIDEGDRFGGIVRLRDLVSGWGTSLPQVRMLLSTRAGETLASSLGRARTTLWSLSSGLGGEESEGDVRSYLAEVVESVGSDVGEQSGFDRRRFVESAASRAGGNFLYARLLAQTLRGRESPLQADDADRLPSGLNEALADLLAQTVGEETEPWLSRLGPLLGALAVAREPLSEAQLALMCSLDPGQVVVSLGQLEPLLGRSDAPHAADRRHRLYHRAFTEFLLDRDAAGRWYCDARTSHDRIARAYRRATNDFAESGWAAADDYGLRHCLEHAVEARWPLSELDPLVAPPLLRVSVDRFHSPVVALVALDVAGRATVADGDPVRALRWAGVASLARTSLREEASLGVGALLVRAGEIERALAGLAAFPERQELRRSLVEELARHSERAMAEALIVEAEPSWAPGLRASLAIGLLDSDIRSAGEIALVAELTSTERARVCKALVSTPESVDLALEIAGSDAEARHGAVRELARYDAPRAAKLAMDSGGYYERRAGGKWLRDRNTLLADVCIASNDVDFALELLGDISDPSELSRAAFSLALELAARGDVRAETMPTQGAAWARELIEVASGTRRAQEQRPGLFAYIRFARYAVDVIDRLPLEKLTRDGNTGQLALAALSRISDRLLERVVEGTATFESFPQAFAAIAGALAVFDVEAALRLAERASDVPHTSRYDVLEGAIRRLTPLDPDRAWEVARDIGTHSCYVAWAEVMPPDRVLWAAERVLTIDARYSSSRAHLASLLGSRLAPGDPQARALLGLLTPAVNGALFLVSRAAVAAGIAATRPAVVEEMAAYVSDQEGMPPSARLLFQEGEIRAGRATDAAGLVSLGTASLRDVGGGRVLASVARLFEGPRRTDGLIAIGNDMSTERLLPQAFIGKAVAMIAESHPDAAARFAGHAACPMLAPVSAHVSRSPALDLAFQLAADALTDAPERAELLARAVVHTVPEDEIPSALDMLADHLDEAERDTLDATDVFDHADDVALLRAVRDGRRDKQTLDALLGAPREPTFLQGLCRIAQSDLELAISLAERARLSSGSDDAEWEDVLIEMATAAAAAGSWQAARDAVEAGLITSAAAFDALGSIAIPLTVRSWRTAIDLVSRVTPSWLSLELSGVAGATSLIVDTQQREAAFAGIMDALEATRESREYCLEALLGAMEYSGVTSAGSLARMIELCADEDDFEHRLARLTKLILQAIPTSELQPELSRMTELLDATAHQPTPVPDATVSDDAGQWAHR